MGCVRRGVKPARISTLLSARRRVGEIVLLVVVMAAAAAPCPGAQPRQGANAGESTSGEKPVRFRVEIDASQHYATLLRERLPLMRWQSSEEVTMPLLRRLVEEARASTLEALATDGYFSASVQATIDEAADPAVVRLQIVTGPRTTVESVQIDFQGAALEDEEGKERIQAVEHGWGLPKGAPFVDSRWVEAKRQALARLGRGRYAAAKLVESEAQIVPEKSAARLRLRLDSGPIFHAGDVRVSGLKRYPPSIVENFNPHAHGEPYDGNKLELYQRRLLETGYFSAVHFAVEPDIAKAQAAPLDIAVIEAPTHALDTGISYSTDVGLGLKVDYRHVNLLDRALRFRTLLDLNEKQQRLNLSVDAPPRPGGVWSTYSAALERSDVQGLISRAASVEYAHNWGLEQVPTRLFVSAHVEERSISGFGREDAHAVFVGYRRTYRTTDAILSPRAGLLGSVEVGVGIPGVSSRGFARARGLLNWLIPVGERNDFLLRSELGAVLAQARTGVPSVFLFRTGGDRTVRGYSFESLGVPLGDATVGGRYLAVASAEYTRWVTDTLGAAVFVDAGDAFDKLKAIDIAFGIGIGLRYKSPIGPVRADVAYGERTGNVRIHFSVGYSF
jgi:translocation and assembly module TamA